VFADGPPEQVLRDEAIERVFSVRSSTPQGMFPREFRRLDKKG
jgi:hypothetical protein